MIHVMRPGAEQVPAVGRRAIAGAVIGAIVGVLAGLAIHALIDAKGSVVTYEVIGGLLGLVLGGLLGAFYGGALSLPRDRSTRTDGRSSG